ncbi:MAG: hypothetical protein AB7P02_22405 [Alphaproteobacteria bacterium]
MFTQHAAVRCRQRGIRPEVIDVLLTFGRRRHRHGAEVCFMDKPGRDHARRALGSAYARIVDRLDAYVVLADDGAIVTAAPRRARLKFH